MKINTFEKCLAAYTTGWSGWQKEFDIQRQESLLKFPYSLIAEGSFQEINTSGDYCKIILQLPDIASDFMYLGNIYSGTTDLKSKKTHTSKNGVWRWHFYGKTDYDYGFCEFFFKDKNFLEKFEKQILLLKTH